MALKDSKITQGEVSSLHVQAAADSYDGDADENKAIFDRLPEKIAEKHNLLIDRLTEHGRPVQSEDIQQIKVDADGDVKVFAGGRWKPVAAAALRKKADKADTYTKKETDRAINEKVVQIGAGDMAKSVYDTDNSGIVDDSEKLGGQMPEYYGTAAAVTAAQAKADAAMPKSGGAFTGEVKAFETATAERALKNNECRSGSTSGPVEQVAYYIDVVD